MPAVGLIMIYFNLLSHLLSYIAFSTNEDDLR